MKDIFALRLYTRVARLGGFSAAARECELSQSQASRIIADLESDLGYEPAPNVDHFFGGGAPLDQQVATAAGRRDAGSHSSDPADLSHHNCLSCW